MAQRITNRKIDTAGLQGEGSFIVIKSLPYGTTRQLNRISALMEQTEKLEELPADEKARVIDDGVAFTDKIIIESLVDWNWVDDRGEAMQLPTKPEDLDTLTFDEVKFIIESVKGSKEAAKN